LRQLEHVRRHQNRDRIGELYFEATAMRPVGVQVELGDAEALREPIGEGPQRVTGARADAVSAR
jgi:hypothetical protein